VIFSYLSFHDRINKLFPFGKSLTTVLNIIFSKQNFKPIWNQVHQTQNMAAELSIMSFNVHFGRKHPYRKKHMWVEEYEVIMRRYFMFTEIVLFSHFQARCFERAGSHLSTLCDEDGQLGLIVGSRRNILNFSHDQQTVDHFSKNNMLSI